MKFLSKPFEQLSDEELMSKAAHGSEPALTFLYQRYSGPMLRYFYRMLWQDKSKAEDFLHDFFLKILERKQSFDASRKFSTWAYSIAHNMCKNEYRKQNFRQAMNGHHVKQELSPEIITGPLDDRSFKESLQRILMEEGSDIQSMFALRYELEMEVAEISQVLQCPEGTIKSRLFYTVVRLKYRIAK
ncbi:MAG: sigma-70 family RNA polymerase sigma factor [Cyclobacteriaceae bacterium]|nr:sigma-70 family RNA polymerase sigma factor [Cyclobacteriaceae bacterium]